MELHSLEDAFESRGVARVAIAQEDTDLESFARILDSFPDRDPGFEILCDVGRKETALLDRTAIYLIGADRRVIEVFPALIHERPGFAAVLNRIDREREKAARRNRLGDPWSEDFAPPLSLDTGRVLLEPLSPEHVKLDYDALMGSREHLNSSLRWGDWPREDFTLEENRADLERHFREFERREAYAYTVLSPDRSRVLGCVYINPPPQPRAHEAVLAYWVTRDQLDSGLDRHLLAAVLDWIERDWPIDRVFVPVEASYARGHDVAGACGLVRDRSGGTLARRLRSAEIHVWER